ncbi:MAG: hypothetical protein WA771_15715 [Chthoniobacterales bacterium]
MKEDDDTQEIEDPRDEAVGNTEPAETTEAEAGGGEEGHRAEAPDGAESEKYPGPGPDVDEE